MGRSSKEHEHKMMLVLNGLRDLAPGKKFGGFGVEELQMQVNKSLAPRQRLREFANEEKDQQALRDTMDIETMRIVMQIVRGVVADPEFGPDSALYESFGYIRQSERKSGLTRKHKGGKDPTP